MLRSLVVFAGMAVTSSGCGPSAEQLACYDACAAEKDTCVLNAKSAAEIQACDTKSQDCDARCY